jgi:hypothetical protein
MPDKLPDAVAAQLKVAEDLAAQFNTTPDPNAVVNLDSPAPSPAPVVEPAPAPPEDFKAQYDTLSGKYNAEVPRLYGEVGDLKVKLAEAMTVINEFQRKINEPVIPAKPIEAPPGLTYLRKEMPELEEAINFLAEQKATQLIKDTVDTRIKETDTKINNLETTTHKTAAGTFYSVLKDKVANWMVINEDSSFLTWLDSVEPYSGMKKADLISLAYDNMDAERVATFFTDYLKSKGVAPAVMPTNDPSKFVAPPKPSGAEPQPSNDRDFITTNEISQFYNDVALGKYKGRDDERKTNEAKINNALATGKIR